MKKHLLGFALVAVSSAAMAETPLWMRDVRISPDGQKVAFTYKGDIYTVPVSGGMASRLTTQTSYETAPVWSPDSRQIAFASDRHGNFDIYIMDADGGAAKRLTTNSARETPEAFSPDGASVYFSAAIQMPVKSAMFPTGLMTQLYSVPVAGGAARQVIGTPAQSISFFPDGKSFVYQNVKGFENEWRKHHTSSVTRDICRYDAETGTHTNLTARPGEDRNPVLDEEGSTVYFLAERDGKTFNVYSAPVSDMSKATQLTSFETHPVRFLSRAKNGMMAFAYDGEIYTLAPGASAPAKLSVDITVDEENDVERISLRPYGGVPSPDGEQIAFISRGDVFVTSVEYPSTKQITKTPAAEMSITWAADNRAIVYTSMRDGHFNIYKAAIGRADDPNFSNATVISEEAVFPADDNIERTYPRYSPDGKQLAFIQDRSKLMVMDVKTKAVRQLTDGSTYSYRDGGFDYAWSPDGKWITLETYGNHHDPYSDIAILNVATGEMTNLTRSGYTDASPWFVMEGNAILFLSERYGMRAHASWGSQDDVMIAFLNQDAYDKFCLSEEDYELRKELEKQKDKGKDSKADGKKKKDKKSKKDNGDGEEDEAEAVKDIVVELDGIEDRIVRLTPYSSSLVDAYVDDEGEYCYFVSSTGDGFNLMKMELRGDDAYEPERAARLDGPAGIFLSNDGEDMFLIGSKMTKYDPKSDKTEAITTSGNMALDHAAERQAMFDQVYLSEREMFYRKDLHGVDWDGMAAAYRRFLPHINNNYDFAEMLSEMLGELNVSHTGAGFRGNEASRITDRTAKLGLLYDMIYTGDGLKVDEIITGGPFDNAWTKLKPGFIIEKINSAPLLAGDDVDALLNNLSGKKTLVSILNPETSEKFDEVVIPVSSSDESDLLYKRWVKQRAADVERWSGGRLGYVHIESMDDWSFRQVYSDLLGKYNNKEGIVIDIRWNGGGRLHEDVEVLFSGEKYFVQEIRGVETCDMPSRRWNKPSVMVQSEACYSNAHGTPWVYKHRGIGKLVGMPVPGTMTSVNWVTLQDPTLYFGIPVVGYKLPDGSYLENTQLEPDILVENNPADVVNGEDAQLHAAVMELLKEIDSKKK